MGWTNVGVNSIQAPIPAISGNMSKSSEESLVDTMIALLTYVYPMT